MLSTRPTTQVEIPCQCNGGDLAETRRGWTHTDTVAAARCDGEHPDTDALRERIVEALQDGDRDLAETFAQVVSIADGDPVDTLILTATATLAA